MSKQIPLTQGKVAIVDDADFEWLNQWKWYACKKHYCWYAVRTQWQDGKNKQIQMHREILKPLADMQTDHKDGNGLNNLRNNLRVATGSQNQHNQKPRKATSKYKGVHWHQGEAKWHAQIRMDKQQCHLGVFVCEIEAARAYDAAAVVAFGEFAYTNFQE